VYTTYRPGSPLAQLEPLNNVRLVNRLKKNTNSERELERRRAEAAAGSAPACTQQYMEDDDLSDCTSERGICHSRHWLSYEGKVESTVM
jgi:hypothetical protein